jgi:hypothetical protein
LEDVLEQVEWVPERITKDIAGDRMIINKGGAIEIRSYGKHRDELMHPLYDKIAFCIDDGGGGCLQYEGEDADDLEMIFFKTRQWVDLWATIQWPENPFTKDKEVQK